MGEKGVLSCIATLIVRTDVCIPTPPLSLPVQESVLLGQRGERRVGARDHHRRR